MNKWKSRFFMLAFLWTISLGIGFYVLVDINKTITSILSQIEDDQITRYIEAGWMPPIGFTKTIRPKVSKNEIRK